MAGAIATIDWRGDLQIVAGLVRPEDMPKPADSGDSAGGDAGDDDTTADDRVRRPAISAPIASPADPQAEARKEAGVGIGLSDDLRSIRTALVKAHLGENFEAAFDLMLFQLGRAVFTHGYQEHALDIAVRETPDRPTMRMNDEEFGSWSPGEAMLADRSSLPLDWLTIEDGGESFAALRALPQDDKQRLFAATVARTVKGQLAFEPQARPELEATIARLDVDFAGQVRPTADMLWSRINKGRILEIARETLGPAWASARAKSKKPDIARAMEEAFAAGSPPLGRHRGRPRGRARLDPARLQGVRRGPCRRRGCRCGDSARNRGAGLRSRSGTGRRRRPGAGGTGKRQRARRSAGARGREHRGSGGARTPWRAHRRQRP